MKASMLDRHTVLHTGLVSEYIPALSCYTCSLVYRWPVFQRLWVNRSTIYLIILLFLFPTFNFYICHCLFSFNFLHIYLISCSQQQSDLQLIQSDQHHIFSNSRSQLRQFLLRKWMHKDMNEWLNGAFNDPPHESIPTQVQDLPERLGQLLGTNRLITELKFIEHTLQSQRNTLCWVISFRRH